MSGRATLRQRGGRTAHKGSCSGGQSFQGEFGCGRRPLSLLLPVLLLSLLLLCAYVSILLLLMLLPSSLRLPLSLLLLHGLCFLCDDAWH